jgi:hypothetical protein
MRKIENPAAPVGRKKSANSGTVKSAPKLAKPAKATPAPKTKAPSKGHTLIAMLSRPEGATIAAMMEASRWQQHSVRGFLAGTVKKKLGRELVSQKEESGRVYRIVAGKAAL